MRRSAGKTTVGVALTGACVATAAAVSGDELAKQSQFMLPK
jgi:hypothetical protein